MWLIVTVECLPTASSFRKSGFIYTYLIMTIFFLVHAVSGLVPWNVSLVFLILYLAEGDESLHTCSVPLFAVSFITQNFVLGWDPLEFCILLKAL